MLTVDHYSPSFICTICHLLFKLAIVSFWLQDHCWSESIWVVNISQHSSNSEMVVCGPGNSVTSTAVLHTSVWRLSVHHLKISSQGSVFRWWPLIKWKRRQQGGTTRLMFLTKWPVSVYKHILMDTVEESGLHLNVLPEVMKNVPSSTDSTSHLFICTGDLVKMQVMCIWKLAD